jgi:Lon protease-like protein
MTNFIPIFPLSLIVYPDEVVNLHIIEPRYKQLITTCYAESKPFGIPAVLQNKLTDFGTLVEIKEIVRIHDNGNMDIVVKGTSVFKILEVINELPDKLYSGAIVNYPANEMQPMYAYLKPILQQIRDLFHLLKVVKQFKKPDETLLSYDVAHHVGLNQEQELSLLGFYKELERIEFLRRHFAQVLPLLHSMDELKEKIKLNGHFKSLKGFNL